MLTNFTSWPHHSNSLILVEITRSFAAEFPRSKRVRLWGLSNRPCTGKKIKPAARDIWKDSLQRVFFKHLSYLLGHLIWLFQRNKTQIPFWNKPFLQEEKAITLAIGHLVYRWGHFWNLHISQYFVAAKVMVRMTAIWSCDLDNVNVLFNKGWSKVQVEICVNRFIPKRDFRNWGEKPNSTGFFCRFSSHIGSKERRRWYWHPWFGRHVS